MTPVDILHAIVTTEEQARALYADAKSAEEAFERTLAAETARLREEIFKAVSEEVEAFDKRETARADREIAELDVRLEQDLSRAKTIYTQNKSHIIEKIFTTMVETNA